VGVSPKTVGQTNCFEDEDDDEDENSRLDTIRPTRPYATSRLLDLTVTVPCRTANEC
jgi:hypothetical protein